VLLVGRGQITVNKRHSNWCFSSLHLKNRRKTTNQKKGNLAGKPEETHVSFLRGYKMYEGGLEAGLRNHVLFQLQVDPHRLVCPTTRCCSHSSIWLNQRLLVLQTKAASMQ